MVCEGRKEASQQLNLGHYDDHWRRDGDSPVPTTL